MTASVQLKFYIFIVLYQKVIGLAPYSYNNLKKKFVTRKWDLIYPFLIMLTYTYYYFVVVLSNDPNPVQPLTWLLYGRLCTFLLSWLVHCSYRKSMVTLFNVGFYLNDIVNKIRTEKEVKVILALLKSGILTVLSSGLHLFALSGMSVLYKGPDVDKENKKIGTIGITLITFSVQAAIPSSFFGMTLIAKLYFKKLNYITSKIMSEAEYKIQHRREKKQPLTEFSDLCTRLDRMCHLHSELTNLSKLFNRIYSFQMLMTFIYYFVNVLSNVYFIYTFMSMPSEDSSLLIFAIISTFTNLFDVWRIGQSCDGLMKEAHKTGVILHRVYIPDEIDIRFQRSVEMFSIQLIQNKLNINACHMFTIDSTLLMAVIISTTTQVIIIIQFDIAKGE